MSIDTVQGVLDRLQSDLDAQATRLQGRYAGWVQRHPEPTPLREAISRLLPEGTATAPPAEGMPRPAMSAGTDPLADSPAPDPGQEPGARWHR